jgi:hypothetical protein
MCCEVSIAFAVELPNELPSAPHLAIPPSLANKAGSYLPDENTSLTRSSDITVANIIE